jgi:hypothetical protein
MELTIFRDVRPEKLESIRLGETEAYRVNIDGNGVSMEFGI